MQDFRNPFEEMHMQITGNKKLWIENYGEILIYNPEKICLKKKNGLLSITGRNLLIQQFSNEDFYVSGVFFQISWEEKL